MSLLGVGGVTVAIGLLTPPSITPQPSTAFGQGQAYLIQNNALKTPTATPGPENWPATPTNSNFWYIEGQVDPNLSAGNSGQYALGATVNTAGLVLNGQGVGSPHFLTQKTIFGTVSSWWLAVSPTAAGVAPAAVVGTKYNQGYYSWTATGGNCVREPSGAVWGGSGAVRYSDPGFNCQTTPTVNQAAIPGVGAQQSGVSITACTSHSPISTQMTVTATTPTAHGVLPAQTFALSGMTNGAFNATTYTALQGTTGTTLVGAVTAASGACPASTDSGNALQGSGGSISLTALSTATPFGTNPGTGITVQTGQKFCGIIGEYGVDTTTPGFQYAAFDDSTGASLPGSPAVVTTPNMGAVSFQGYTVVGSQPALTVTAMNAYSISAASFATSTGYATFTTTAAHGMIPGSEFTVSGATTSGGGNFGSNATPVTYIAVIGTTGSTLVGNPLSGPLGTPQSAGLTNSSAASTGSLVGVIVPGMQVLGTSGSPATILPYQLNGGSGTGGTGSYALTTNQTTIGFSATISGTVLTITVAPTGNQFLVPGEALNTTGGVASGTQILSLASGSGGVGSTYNINISQTISSSTAMQGTGAIWTSGAGAGNIFAWQAFYHTAAPSTAAYGGVTTARAQSSIGDWINTVGGYSVTTPPQFAGWGGSLANFGDFFGVFPSTNSSPNVTGSNSLASLCTKTTDFQTFATTNNFGTTGGGAADTPPRPVHSLYRLSDPGIWGDSSNAVITGYLDTTTGTSGGTSVLHVLNTVSGSLTLASGTETANITGPGLAMTTAGVPPTIPLTATGSSSYTVTFPAGVTSVNLGSVGSPVTFSVGAFKPAVPAAAAQNGFNGYIDSAGLHVTSVSKVALKGTLAYPTNSFTALIDSDGSGTSGVAGNIMNVYVAPVPTFSMQVGAVITGTGVPANTYITSYLTGGGSNSTGKYQLNNSVKIEPAEAMTSQLATPASSGVGSVLTPVNLTVTGGAAKNMLVTDGGVNITGQPLYITSATGACGTNCFTVNSNYYPPITSAENMYGTLTNLSPGQYLYGNSSITTPIKITGLGTGANAPGLCATGEWGCGLYTLSNPAALTIGSSGSPVPFNATYITDGGAVAPGPALTINDPGPGVSFPVTNYGASMGTLTLAGTYNTGLLGGTPSGIQVLVSSSAQGSALSGCTPCNWGTLTGSIFGGNWSGTIAGIPAGGPYYVSVRAANGTSYATLPSPVKVGLVFDVWGVGQSQPVINGLNGGCYFSVSPGTWSQVFAGGWNAGYDSGPAVAGTLYPAQSQMIAGDQSAVTGSCGAPLAEGSWALSTGLQTSMGLPTSIVNWTRDGAGFGLFSYGGTNQTQTIGTGNGTLTQWCSATTFCSNVGTGGTLTWNLAGQTGGMFSGSISGNTLTVTTLTSGALMPGLVLNDNIPGGTNSVTGSPTLVKCNSGCSGVNGSGSQWTISGAGLTVSSETMRADPAGGALTPYDSPQNGGTGLPLVTQKANQIMKAGTFTITDSVSGVLCTDSNTAVYNIMGGNCTGAGVSSSFVNYTTGDYQVTFSSAPASGHVLTASWTEIVSTDDATIANNVFNQIDFTGDGTAHGGFLSNTFAREPGGSSGHVFAACFDGGDIYNAGFPMGAQGFTERVQGYFSVKIPALFPAMQANTPAIITGDWRGDGSLYYQPINNRNVGLNALCDQWANDATLSSNFTGAISAAGGSSGAWTAILTLSGAATGPMWEGEVVGCATFSVGCAVTPGTYIKSVATGAWGASGSTYNLANGGAVAIANISATALANAVFYSAGPAIFVGPQHDNSTVPPVGGPLGSDGFTAHPSFGWTGPRRLASRWAADIWGGLTTASNASEPTLDRVKADYAACDAASTVGPCLDIGNTYAASASGTISGSTITITGGLSAHARPFVPGMALSCAGCTAGRVILSVSVPPTQSGTLGAGQVGQTFAITASGTMGVSTTETVTGGCSGTSGVGSNCIDFHFNINTGGTYGTAAALSTCGENNLAGYNGGTQVWNQLPNGTCSSNGIGSLVRGFRIGTKQAMNGGTAASVLGLAGSPYDDGIDPYGGVGNQSAAFTCNIVAAKEVQCVKGAAYSGGVFSSIGSWSTGSTYASYGDTPSATERFDSLVGNVGGQPFGITPGSGYTNGTYTISLTGCSNAGGTHVTPQADVTVAGGQIVNAYVSTASGAIGYGVGLGCTVPLTSLGAGTGGAVSIPVWPFDGASGIAIYNSSINMTGDWLYDNSGFPGNPLNSFFSNGRGGYYEPGLPVRPFGEFMGALVSG
jgi:hypothetical protein